MNEFETHFRKDVKLLTSDTMFIFLIVLLALLSFFIALSTCSAYVYSITYGESVVTKHSLELAQIEVLARYWASIGNIFTVIFLAASAMAISVEKDTGMSKYALSFRVRKPVFYLSKMALLLILVAIALLMALVAYLVVFSFMDVPMLEMGSLLASMLFPALSMLVFVALGLALATLASKKGATVALAVVVFMALTLFSAFSITIGTQAGYRAHPTAVASNVTEYIPLEYKLLIYGNPVIIGEGTNYILDVYPDSGHLFDPVGGVLLSIGFFVAFLALGLLSFSRERMDRSWIAAIKGWRRSE